MQIRQYFPVPILVHDVDPELRSDIERRVLEEIDADLETPAGEYLHTTFFTDGDFIGRHLPKLADEVMRCGRELASSLKLQEPRRISRSWLNAFTFGQQERPHHHLGQGIVLSGCYYVRTPAGGGRFFFQDPIRERVAHAAHYGTGDDGQAVEIEHRDGQLIVFPAWLFHGVSANHSREQRVSIAFNLTAEVDR